MRCRDIVVQYLISQNLSASWIDVYKRQLDESLKQFNIVYPAAGDDHSAVKLTIAELEDASQDVYKRQAQESRATM